MTAAPDAVRVVADVIAPWFPVGTDESFEAGAREILADRVGDVVVAPVLAAGAAVTGASPQGAGDEHA